MVYLVDDDIDDVELVEEALHSNNYQGKIAKAANGHILMASLMELGDDKPELIVLDLNMPLKSGFDVLKEIKTHAILKSIPVIILTASSRKEDEIKCIELGCSLFLRKPTTLADYNSLVHLILKFLKLR